MKVWVVFERIVNCLYEEKDIIKIFSNEESAEIYISHLINQYLYSIEEWELDK